MRPVLRDHGRSIVAEVAGNAIKTVATVVLFLTLARAATAAPTQETPEARARAVLGAQLEALPANDAAFMATFVKDAVVMLPGFAAKLTPELEIGGQVANMNPHATMKSATLKSIVAGGSASLVWFAAEVEIVVESHEPQFEPSIDKDVIRAVELLDAASDWKVVAASFTRVHALSPMKISRGGIPGGTTEPGPLAKLAASPKSLADLLAADPVVVFGTDGAERAVGQTAAKALLGQWKNLSLTLEAGDKFREVHTDHWGYALADVNIAKPGGAPLRMSAFVVAVPSGGTWSVLAVSYGAF